jgi:hypothetical protein
MNPHSPASPAPAPIEEAREKTGKVQQDLHVASAELHLSNTALDRHLPDDSRAPDVDRALAQNEAVEEKVQGAADELSEVTELLEREVAQRQELERQLAARAEPQASR